jgi:predicted DNA-binding protein (MmcQ/YjbR family)
MRHTKWVRHNMRNNWLMAAKNPRLAKLTKLCLALPEAAVEIHGSHATFRVRTKVFAYFLDNHHGDGIVAVSCKAGPEDNTALVAAQPDRFYLPAYIGPRGWVALRLDIGDIDWDEVNELVVGSYRLTAPRTLAATVRLAGG